MFDGRISLKHLKSLIYVACRMALMFANNPKMRIIWFVIRSPAPCKCRTAPSSWRAVAVSAGFRRCSETSSWRRETRNVTVEMYAGGEVSPCLNKRADDRVETAHMLP